MSCTLSVVGKGCPGGTSDIRSPRRLQTTPATRDRRQAPVGAAEIARSHSMAPPGLAAFFHSCPVAGTTGYSPQRLRRQLGEAASTHSKFMTRSRKSSGNLLPHFP